MDRPESSSRQIAVRKAIVELSKHGLRIGSLEVHPETMSEIISEYTTFSILNVNEISSSSEAPQLEQISMPITYMGIPLEQKV